MKRVHTQRDVCLSVCILKEKRKLENLLLLFCKKIKETKSYGWIFSEEFQDKFCIMYICTFWPRKKSMSKLIGAIRETSDDFETPCGCLLSINYMHICARCFSKFDETWSKKLIRNLGTWILNYLTKSLSEFAGNNSVFALLCSSNSKRNQRRIKPRAGLTMSIVLVSMYFVRDYSSFKQSRFSDVSNRGECKCDKRTRLCSCTSRVKLGKLTRRPVRWILR